jgi:S-formylglutathione hydrolase FrmB
MDNPDLDNAADIVKPGFVDVRWRSHVMGKAMSFLLYKPRPAPPLSTPSPVLYLLHGSGHDRMSVAGQVLSAPAMLALGSALLVVPDGDQGWWLDSLARAGSRYAEYFWELVAYVDSHYDTCLQREKRGVCGFSMGGYGAFHLASEHPDRIGSASSLLGTLDIVQLFPDYHRLNLLLGPNLAAWRLHNPHDVAHKLGQTRMWFCAAQDGLDRPQNEAFAQKLSAAGLPFEFHMYSGNHDTQFVREHIAEALAFHRAVFDQSMPGSVEFPQAGK